jgi:DNA primase
MSLADVKSQVLAATDIVALIGQSVELKRRGKNYVGLCPFHQERSPSFNVNPAKQYYMCFGCKKSGNAIDFVIERDKVEFLDALKQLAQKANIDLPKFGLSKEKTSQRQQLLDAHTAAATFFRDQLQRGPLAATAREYLVKRGFTDDTIFRFGIGVTGVGWDALIRSPGLAKFPPDLLAEAGLAKARSGDGNRSSGHYDTFRNRLMFPIRDESGRVIAFGGRVLPGSDDPAKYLNSPESPLFSKSRCIYGLDLAREEIQRTGTVAIVEGYTDVAMAHQFGVTNVVSILGTAMTPQHLGILRRFAKKVVLLFDADTAGDTAVRRTLELFIQEPIELCVASLADATGQDLDPDEYLLAHGAAGFNQILASASDALTFLWKTMRSRLGQNPDLTTQQQSIAEYLDLIARARAAGPVDMLRWGGILARVSKLTQIPAEELHKRFRATPPRYNRPTSPTVAQPNPDTSQPIPPKPSLLTAYARAESQLLGTLLANPHLWAAVQAQISPAEFRDPERHRLAELFWTIMQHEGADSFAELLSHISEHNLSHLAIVLVEGAETAHNSEAVIADVLQHFAEVKQRQREQDLVSSAQAGSDSPSDAESENRLLKSLSESVKRPDPWRNLRRPTGNA